MPSTFLFAVRRQNPSMFPEVCPICTPQRRFRRPKDKARHDTAKHGTLVREPRESYTSSFSTATSSPFSNYSCIRSSHHGMASAISQPRFLLNSLSTATAITQPKCKLYSLSRTDLDRFVKDEIEPDTAYNDSCKAVINRLCQFMKNNFPNDLRPAEIIKSGSLGKGTAVKGKSDADLVVFLSSPRYGSISGVKRNMETILEQMSKYLRDGDCVFKGTTPHAVKVSVSCHTGYSHEVDILPSFNVLEKESTSQIYEKMRYNFFEREHYSAALAPLQLDFVSKRSTKLKTLIRLVKYWRKTAFKESTSVKRLPSSYPLELITIGEWWDVDRPKKFDLRRGFYNVLKALADYKSLAHLWTINYDESDVSSGVLKGSDPYVMDPANPFNNVMTSCNCWEEVARKARECLMKPMFSDLNENDGWV